MERKQPNTSTRKGRKSYWSVVDTMILLLVIASIAGIIYRVVMTVSQESEEEAGSLCEVYFEVQETHRDVLAEVRGFDAVYLHENNVRLGAIGATIDVVTGDTVAALATYPIEGTELATASGCMVCRGTIQTNGGILVAGADRYLTRGSILEIRTDRVLLTVKITDIRVRS